MTYHLSVPCYVNLSFMRIVLSLNSSPYACCGINWMRASDLACIFLIEFPPRPMIRPTVKSRQVLSSALISFFNARNVSNYVDWSKSRGGNGISFRILKRFGFWVRIFSATLPISTPTFEIGTFYPTSHRHPNLFIFLANLTSFIIQ